MPKIVTASEVAEFLRLSYATVCKMLVEGQLPGFKIGDSWRLDMDEVMEHIAAAKIVAKHKPKRDVSRPRLTHKTPGVTDKKPAMVGRDKGATTVSVVRP